MIKCRIHIHNEMEFMDERVMIEISLPCLPTIGSIIYITDEQEEELENQALKNNEVFYDYSLNAYYDSKGVETIEKIKNRHDFSFRDHITVSNIKFTSDVDYVDIELS